MTNNKPKPLAGLHHVALYVEKLTECKDFYVSLLGMTVEWQPDENNIYLTSGNDNLALHRAASTNLKTISQSNQRLDHIGFIVRTPEEVDEWHEYLHQNEVSIAKKPKTHRDGARSFYCYDPDGTVVQLIYHPPLASG